MRVAIVGTDGDGSLARSLASGTADQGHEVHVFDFPQLAGGSRALFLARRVHADRAAALPSVRRLRARLRSFRPDLVLVVKGRFLRGDAVRRLRSDVGAPLLNYYPDHPLWPGHDDPEIVDALHEYDDVIVWGADVRDALEDAGLDRVRVVRFGYDPAVYRLPAAPVPARWDAALVGQCYPQRLRFAESLADLDVLVSGLGWTRAAQGGPLAARVADRSYPGSATCALYWQSRVALNVLSDWNVPAHNMRTFEIPASGTAMVATRTSDHEELFGEDGAMLVSTPAEAREAVRTLLGDRGLRERIARTGRERVEPHTYAARMREILAPWAAERAR